MEIVEVAQGFSAIGSGARLEVLKCNQSVPRGILDLLHNGGFQAHRTLQGVKTRMKSRKQRQSAEHAAKDIRRKKRREFNAEEKIRIVLESLQLQRNSFRGQMLFVAAPVQS